ncbi:YjbQ family protein [Vallitalea pronyensis]|uniref:YjbQ family protein n=2 Tax=Vallitalea pronyensis TaxID=1348613 RepID=A0A8J8MQA7_9FIRM|nr:secondary thiamine-phosphate synthase enzyme YjbQ [Vallitalea pronyensis]QUI25657.1 YjbQ family protein [Vallitalea pronyensis]
MITTTYSIQTNSHTQMKDITHQIQGFIREKGIQEGLCTIFIPHTTAGVTINENADPDVTKDMLMELNKIVPLEDNYRHMEGNAAAHIKSSMMGFSESIIIKDGKLLLGTWQGVYFCEFDGPRRRKYIIQILT